MGTVRSAHRPDGEFSLLIQRDNSVKLGNYVLDVLRLNFVAHARRLARPAAEPAGDEVEITPEMIQAGAAFLSDFLDQGLSMADWLARGCFEAMCKASHPALLRTRLADPTNPQMPSKK
jgi:hypothetical protein